MSLGLSLAILIAPAHAALAQQPPAGHQHDDELDPAAASAAWTWSGEASAFFGFNYQHRKFTDFSQWESQNWVMGTGQRRIGRGAIRLVGMLSLEPFTMQELGSPQVFQTGEAFRSAPLIDYQHPHDLFMALGADYTVNSGPIRMSAGLHAVGAPTLGPQAFMHRPSAAGNPQAPLSHHYLDSTHITPGVLRGGIGRGPWLVEGSWFHGREPDEHRTDLDLGPLDSVAARVTWSRGHWTAQTSGARLAMPEVLTPFDASKLTASVAYTAEPGARIEAWMAAFGQKREAHGNLEAYLFEAVFRASRSGRIYTRAESVAKDILDAGFHPPEAFHRHRQSQVGALTLGYRHAVAQTRAGIFSIGADVTGYAVPGNLVEPYGSPFSVHAFVHVAKEPPSTIEHAH